jgi:pilus assembly protein Flp/PilA
MSLAKLRLFIGDESGATAIEYGLLGMLVAIAIIGSFTLLGNSLQGLFNNGTAAVITNQTATLQ